MINQALGATEIRDYTANTDETGSGNQSIHHRSHLSTTQRKRTIPIERQ